MYQTPIYGGYNPQASIDRINNQIAELEKMKQQLPQSPIPQPTNLTQNFQLAPSNRDVIKYASSIEEVKRDMVIGDTPYFSKDMSVVWIKNTRGDIKSYELKEIVEKDEKDLQIEFLMNEINKLKGMRKDEQFITNDDEQDGTANTTKNDKSVRTTIKEDEPTSVQRVPRSKTK